MCTPDGRYSLVFNGAIYNYVELRASLVRRGIQFSTTSDTEVLLNLLATDGVAAIESLVGMFAFVFHDRATNRWIAARDPFGIKPLYLYATTRRRDVRVRGEGDPGEPVRARRTRPPVACAICGVSVHAGSPNDVRRDRAGSPATYVEGRGDAIIGEHRYWTPNTSIDIDEEEDVAELMRQVLDDSVRIATAFGCTTRRLPLRRSRLERRLRPRGAPHRSAAEGVPRALRRGRRLRRVPLRDAPRQGNWSRDACRDSLLARLHRPDAGDDSIARRAGRRPRGVSPVHGQQTGFTGGQGRPRRPRRR